jgi:hypothetical protein
MNEGDNTEEESDRTYRDVRVRRRMRCDRYAGTVSLSHARAPYNCVRAGGHDLVMYYCVKYNYFIIVSERCGTAPGGAAQPRAAPTHVASAALSQARAAHLISR